jgi:hypothetical protein
MINIGKNGFAGMVLSLLLLAGCGVSGLDGIGGGSPGEMMGDELRGTIDRIDFQDQSFLLTPTDMATSSLVNRGDSTRIYFDDRTSITYDGRTVIKVNAGTVATVDETRRGHVRRCQEKGSVLKINPINRATEFVAHRFSW